ncbi:thioesterase family protein [Brevibacterium daeguense]|uniref:Thioesterase family protein n=1 Tax=Brevibacterium daeguense TaxID=909936 RepID=A0ABP8EIV5_9MICO|nr:thioesterase family protein [Brevibacterium daeguense]
MRASTDSTTAVRTFAEATAVTATTSSGVGGSGRFTADIDPDWTIGGKPNGGYLEAIMARAATAVAAHPQIVAASTHFFRAPDPGPADLEVEFVTSGRTTSQVRVRLSQQGKPKVEAMFTLGRLPQSGHAEDPSGPALRWQHPAGPAMGRPLDECPRYFPPASEFAVPILHQVDLRLEPDAAAFARGEPRGIGELRAWFDLPGQDSFDTIGLLLAADIMPPATFDIAPSGWVPTLELTTYVRALPAAGPVNIHLVANLIQGDRVDETCTIWDSRGTLVARAHQLAGIRLP